MNKRIPSLLIAGTVIAACAGSASAAQDTTRNGNNPRGSDSTFRDPALRHGTDATGISSTPYDTNSSYRTHQGQSSYQTQGSNLATIEATRASEIIGMNVKGSDGNIGEVKDIVVDVEQGRIAAVLVGSGGILGLGGKTRALPASQFNLMPHEKQLVVGYDKQSFRDLATVRGGHHELLGPGRHAARDFERSVDRQHAPAGA